MFRTLFTITVALTLTQSCSNRARQKPSVGTAEFRPNSQGASPATNPAAQPTPYVQPSTNSNQLPQAGQNLPTNSVPVQPAQPPQNPGLIEFHIAPGTGQGPWNDSNNPLILKMAPNGVVTLRIINDDSAGHTLHTNGFPCPHGNILVPLRTGAHYDCMIRGDFDSVNDAGSFHDHLYGAGASFSVRTQR